MRLKTAIFPLLALLAGAHAQEQERKLIDRIMNPDESLAFDVRQSSPFRRAPGSYQAGSANVKEFYIHQSTSPKTFSTRAYGGARTDWQGDFKFSTKDASTKGRYEIPNAAKATTVKDAPVKDAREANKTMETRALPGGERPFLNKGRSQDLFDAEGPAAQDKAAGWKGDLRSMSIDDIRTLLNKNK